MSRPMRLGLLYPAKDPTSPDNWSGTPRGLTDGFTHHGLEVVPVPYELPTGLRQAVALTARASGRRGAVARRSPVAAAARTRALEMSFRAVGKLDALLAMQTDSYDLARVVGRASLPIATYDDGTFALFARHPDSEITRFGFPSGDVARWAARQGIACRRATVACVSTSWAGRSVIEDFGVPAARVAVVGMGHRARTPMEGVARDFSRPQFLFVGVDWGRKNGDAVLRAFARLRETHPTATLEVVGEHPPLDDVPGVTGHGFLRRSDPAAQLTLDLLFARATAFVLPSRFDPSPIAYLEAASAGLPVIATTEGGAGELLGDAAITVHPDDDDALFAAMVALADEKTAARMGEEASRMALKSSWLEVSARILDALNLDALNLRP